MDFTRPASIFISYSHKDSAFVDTFAALLQLYGLNIWRDKKDIPIGGNLVMSVYEGIKNSSHFCCVISHSSINSPWVIEEISSAKVRQLSNQTLRILPILIDPVEVPDYFLQNRCAHLENRDLSPQNPEFIMFLQALGIGIESKSSYVVTGQLRRSLVQKSNEIDRIGARIASKYSDPFYRLALDSKRPDPIFPPGPYIPRDMEDLVWRTEVIRALQDGPPSTNARNSAAKVLGDLKEEILQNDIRAQVTAFRELGDEAGLKGLDVWDELDSALEEFHRLLVMFVVDSPDYFISHPDIGLSTFSWLHTALVRFNATCESWQVFELEG